MQQISAKDFNKEFAIGSVFLCQPSKEHGIATVKTIGPARDFEKSGTVVEINKAPYFVKVTALTAA